MEWGYADCLAECEAKDNLLVRNIKPADLDTFKSMLTCYVIYMDDGYTLKGVGSQVLGGGGGLLPLPPNEILIIHKNMG